MEIRGERIVLRPWRSGDEDDLVRYGDDRRVWRNLTDRFPHPYTRTAATEWIELNLGMTGSGNFAIELDGAAIGGVGFERLADLAARSAEMGYWLGFDFWGRGYATEAARLITEHAFAACPDLARLQAGVLAWNPASCRVLAKSGYHFEAVLRQAAYKDETLVDLHLYARLRDEHEGFGV